MPLVTSFPTGGLDDVYFQEVRPPQVTAGVPSDVIGAVITASRGPLNVATSIGSASQLATTFGNLSTGLAGYLDVIACFQQGASSMQIVRVAADNATPASYILLNGSSAALLYLEASSIGTWANSVTLTVGAGSVTGTTRLTFSLGREINVYDNLTLTTAAGIAAAITSINTSGTLVRASQPVTVPPATAPTLGTATTTGTILANTYYFSYSWYNLQGETPLSPEANIATTGTTSTITITPGSKPVGALGYRIYVGTTSGSKSRWGSVLGAAATTLTLPADVAPNGAAFPTQNTATLPPQTVSGFAVSAGGTLYTTAPAVLITGGGGSGAVGQAIISAGAVVRIDLIAGGSGYTGNPSVAFSGGGGSGATATATANVQNLGAPTNATTTLAGGVDGASAPTSVFLGSNSSYGNSGLYALTAANPLPSFAFLGSAPVLPGQPAATPAGGNDANSWATQISVASLNGWIAVLCAPQGTSQIAVQLLTATLDSDFAVFPFPWQLYYEPTVYQANVLISPVGYWAGTAAVQPINVSPGNKNILASVGPEFSLSRSQMTALIDPAVRVCPVGQLIDRGGLGIVTGLNLSTTAAINQVYRRRMATYLERSLGTVLGQFIDQPNTPQTQAAVTQTVTAFLMNLAAQGLIGDVSGASPGWAVYCNAANNPLSSLQAGVLNVYVQVMLFSSLQQLRVQFEVGPTVVLVTPAH